MAKRYFVINTGRYGGEVTVGRVQQQFVEYWSERLEEDGDSDLIEHVYAASWDDTDGRNEESCDLTEDGDIPWHDIDDFEHLNGAYADNEFGVVEVKLHEDAEVSYGSIAWKEGVDWEWGTPQYEEIGEMTYHDYNHLYSREAYSCNFNTAMEMIEDEDNNAQEEDFVPVMTFHSAEKGGFGELVVVTNGEDFDPDLLAIGVCETDVCEIIESYWYDGQELEVCWDYADTTGKATYVNVGMMNTKWHDSLSDYSADSDFIKEALEEFKDSVEWVKEQREKEAVSA